MLHWFPCSTLDEEIRNIVHAQTTGHDGKLVIQQLLFCVTMVIISSQALEEAYKTIELLFDRIKSISEKAERSEQTVNKKIHYIILVC